MWIDPFLKKIQNPMKAKTLCIPALAALLATQARAVDLTSTWTGLGVNNSWGSAANWNIAPTFGNNQIVVFTGTTRLLNAIAQDRTIKSLSYDANADNPFFNRLRNGTGDNEVGRVLTFQSDTGVSTISMDAGATASHQIITGTITSPGTAGRIVLANQLNVVQDSASVLTLADTATIISGGTGATINKSGTGILILGGTNTFTDAVNINAGTLRIGSGGALGTNAGGTFVADGASLDVAGVKITTAGENISIIGNGVGGLGALFSSTGNQAQSNIGVNLILTGDASVGVSGARNGVTSGTISSGGMNYTLTKVGTGQFDTEASSINVGDIVVNQGIFQTAFVTTINTGFPIIVNSGAEFRMFELVNPLARNFALNGGTINSTASVNVTGDTISGNVTLTGSGTINSAGGTGDFLTISGNIGESAPGATLNIGGTQTVALAGTNTYTGATTVTSGALRASGTFTSDITVSTGTTLDGEGSTTGLLTLNDGANLLFNPTTTGPNQHFRTNNVTVGGLIAVRPSTLGSGTNIVVLETTTGTLNPGDFYLLGSPGELSVGAGGTQLLYTNAGANLEWRALVDNIWGEFGPENFQNLTTASPSAFTSGDNVAFVNTGAGTVTFREYPRRSREFQQHRRQQLRHPAHRRGNTHRRLPQPHLHRRRHHRQQHRGDHLHQQIRFREARPIRSQPVHGSHHQRRRNPPDRRRRRDQHHLGKHLPNERRHARIQHRRHPDAEYHRAYFRHRKHRPKRNQLCGTPRY
jgi:autotransporter-associated beta strand protein